MCRKLRLTLKIIRKDQRETMKKKKKETTFPKAVEEQNSPLKKIHRHFAQLYFSNIQSKIVRASKKIILLRKIN